MKSEVNMSSMKEDNYPCLKRMPVGLCVLFVSPSTGTVVSTGYSYVYPLGYYSEGWSSGDFVRLNGSVTLSND